MLMLFSLRKEQITELLVLRRLLISCNVNPLFANSIACKRSKVLSELFLQSYEQNLWVGLSVLNSLLQNSHLSKHLVLFDQSRAADLQSSPQYFAHEYCVSNWDKHISQCFRKIVFSLHNIFDRRHEFVFRS